MTWQTDGDFHVPAVPLSERLVTAACAEADKLQLNYRTLPSWAGHDAQIFAGAGVPTVMLFVPSVRGISHAPEEYSTPENIFQGCCLLDAVLKKLVSEE